MNRISPKSLLLTLSSLLLIAYLLWGAYWYTQVGLMFIHWHTHLMAYVYMWSLLLLFFKFFRQPSPTVRNFFLSAGAIPFALLAAETFLTITGTYKTESEKVWGSYISPYDLLPKKNYYHIWPPYEHHTLSATEYSYPRFTNALGFPDPDWNKEKKRGVIRILALGDSFTEGDGTPYDSSYVSIMRRILSSRGDSVYIMNAGTCGSDPFFNFVNLRDRLLVYKPDIVIQSIGSNDTNTDILMRGGMERFTDHAFMKAPWWEPIYAISYVSRVFFAYAGYDQQLQKKYVLEKETGRINKSVQALFKEYDQLCRLHNIKLFVVLHPQIYEITQNYYSYDFRPIIDSMKTGTSTTVIDLLPYYRAYIDSTHTNPAQYYWVHNGHHNPKGYKMMAETTLNNIMPMLNDSGVYVK
jgi:lysophospholipase L1-like esterase